MPPFTARLIGAFWPVRWNSPAATTARRRACWASRAKRCACECARLGCGSRIWSKTTTGRPSVGALDDAGRETKASGDTIRILIADDHVTVREGLAAMIGRQPDMAVVADAANGRDAVDLWLRHRPDVTLLDLRMPVVDGIT